ncbi:MAG: peptide-methionine (S)-S-oxide reductase MsrA [Nanoarchaeota archaeon]
MKTKTAIFAAGCFWHPEQVFSKVQGVISTEVGYIGGKMENPNYAKVCSGISGHVEATKIIFNPKKISYKDLLEIFWEVHNPTQKDRQGVDIGKQYNSVIFYIDLEQKEIAEKSKEEKQVEFGGKIATEIKKATKFYPAEEYHQKYFEKQKRGF